MTSGQARINLQAQLDSTFQTSASATTKTAPARTEPLDIEQFIMDNSPHTQNNQAIHTPLDGGSNSLFEDFSFPYHAGRENGFQSEPKLDNASDSYPISGRGAADNRGSIPTRQTTAHRTSFSSSVAVGQAGNTRESGGSDEASPSSNRASGGGMDGGYGDDLGLGGGEAGEGSDLGGRQKEDKNDPTPPWSDLKTKAGKERKRLPLACIACRRKKIRCSGEKPACKHCLRARIPCVYKVTTRKAAPRTDYMAMLDKRLKRMEERIIKIVPKEEQDNTVPIIRASVKPAVPGTSPVHGSAGKKRAADEAFSPDLDSWSKSVANANMENGAKPTTLMIQEAEETKLLSEGADALPSTDIQEHLSEVFFENLYGQTYHLLHKPSFMRKLKAGTVPPVLILAVCAVSARFSTHPKLNTTPAFLRGEQWASEARDIVMRRYEWPNITILTCLLILGLHEFGTCQGGRSWALGGQAIRMAYALQLHRDLDYDPLKLNGTSELSFIDREIRRRTMWSCFLMDRFNSSGTDRPTFIKEETMKIQLPITEKFFHLDMPGPTENLVGEVPHPVTPGAGQLSDARENMGVAAYVIRVISLWGRIINYLNQGGNKLDPHPMWHPESFYADLVKQSDSFIDALPESFKYSQETLHNHQTNGQANQFLFLHISIQQNILFMNRFAVPGHAGGHAPTDVPKEFVTRAGAKAFAAANRISELLRDGESHFVTAPFTGYCAFLSSTVHVFGVFSKNAAIEAASKKNLATNVKYLSKMKRYWGMFHWMSENLKEQYRLCADAARHGISATRSKQSAPSIFQYGDWFDRYPHGVSQSDFEDPAAEVKKEKGDDAVLEQKSDYHTVEEFFNTLPTFKPQDSETIKPSKRKAKRSTPIRREPVDVVNTNMPNIPAEPQMQVEHNNPQVPQAYNQMSPPPPVNLYDRTPYFENQLLLPPHQRGLLPHLDRQLVLGAYAGMDPSSLSSQSMLDGVNSWDMQMGGMMGLVSEPTSAWLMPFNMEPPEFGQEVDIFSTFGSTGQGFGMGGMPIDNNGDAMGEYGRGN